MSCDISSIRPLGASLVAGPFDMIAFGYHQLSGLVTYREILGSSDTSRSYQASGANRDQHRS